STYIPIRVAGARTRRGPNERLNSRTARSTAGGPHGGGCPVHDDGGAVGTPPDVVEVRIAVSPGSRPAGEFPPGVLRLDVQALKTRFEFGRERFGVAADG